MRIDLPALIGVISDTHGSLDSRVVERFAGVDLIIHAGDIGSPAVLMELETLAPVVAVRGNTDEARWAEDLPSVATVTAGHHRITVVHDPGTPLSPGSDVVVSGHTHRPWNERRDGRLYLNPGSPSNPRGPGARSSVGLLVVDEHRAEARIIEI